MQTGRWCSVQVFRQFFHWSMGSGLKWFLFLCCGRAFAPRNWLICWTAFTPFVLFDWNYCWFLCLISMFTSMLSPLSGSTESWSISRCTAFSNRFFIDMSLIVPSSQLSKYCRNVQLFHIFSALWRRKQIDERLCCEVGWKQFLAFPENWALSYHRCYSDELSMIKVFVSLCLYWDR